MRRVTNFLTAVPRSDGAYEARSANWPEPNPIEISIQPINCRDYTAGVQNQYVNRRKFTVIAIIIEMN